MMTSANYFNAHANANRIMGTKSTNSLGVVHQANPAPAILAKDEIAYSRAMEKAAMGKRQVKVTIQKSPWE